MLAKVPKTRRTQVKAADWAIFDVPDTVEPGLDAVAYVQKRIDAFESVGTTPIRRRYGACSTSVTR